MRERLLALAVLLVGIALARAAPLALAVVAVALPLVGLVVGPRLRLDRVGQAALTIGAMALGVLAPRLLVTPEELAGGDPTKLGERTLLLAMPMLSIAATRTLVTAPLYGARLTLAAALFALSAAGRAATGLVYPALAGLAIAAGLAALYAVDPTRPSLRQLSARHVVALGLGALSAGGLSIVSAWVMPRLHDAAVARVMARWSRNRTSFSDQMYLGAMAGLLQSDVVVMRVRGGAPPLLRGAVFTTYAGGRWESDAGLTSNEVVETHPSPPDPTALVAIENARKPARYFLPLGARDVVVSSGIYERSPLAIYSPSTRFEAKRVWYAEGGGLLPQPPRAVDQQVPSRLKPTLVQLLDAWGIAGHGAEGAEGRPGAQSIGPATARARARAIAAALEARYQYSVDFDRQRGTDPLIDFLTVSRRGHCEYFASAFALLARAAGLPARVIAGYRVVETSPLGYRVVRERNAHSWVEVWLDDRWEAIDPTPAAELSAASPERTPLLSALADGIATAWERIDDWVERRSAFELSLSLVALVALLIGARVLRGGTRSERAAERGDAPLPGFVALARALAGRGVARAPTETLGRFAARVEREAQLDAELKARAADLVRRYELLRYAGQGDATVVDREMSEAARVMAALAGRKVRA